MTAGAPPFARTTRTSGQPRVHQQLHNTLGTALHLRSPRRVGAHRLDGDQRCQIGEDAGKLGFDLVTERHGMVDLRS